MAEINLHSVAETAVWTLYNRATEARRPDGVLDDPACVQVFEAVDYPYERTFGKDKTGLHGEKARIFDAIVRAWLAEHPGGTVVELGAGLETQFQRVDNGTVRWICVDLEDVILVREKFFPPAERCRCIAADVRDLSWSDHVGPGPVLITAQGLLMFLSEDQVRQLIVAIAEKFPGAEIVFDVISPMVSKRTMRGYDLTEHFRFPAMPWGVKRNDIVPLLQGWLPGIAGVETQSFGAVHGVLKTIKPLVSRTPVLRDILPVIVRLHAPTSTEHSC